jgi:deazaflavin-dependent oxidoreductase (nitroreductase family)
MPGFAMVTYVGRRSGRLYRLPLNLFRRGDEYTFALTYGPDVQWVQNVLAAGGCEIESGGRVTRLVEPRLVHDPTRSRVPQPVRTFLGLIGVHEFLVLREDRARP